MQATNILYLFGESRNWLSVLPSLKSNLVTFHVLGQELCRWAPLNID